MIPKPRINLHVYHGAFAPCTPGPARRYDDSAARCARAIRTNGICERFHKTVLNEFYRVAFRKMLYASIAEIQADLDAWLEQYNEVRTHLGRWCYGKTPMQTFRDSPPLAKENMISAA